MMDGKTSEAIEESRLKMRVFCHAFEFVKQQYNIPLLSINLVKDIFEREIIDQ